MTFIQILYINKVKTNNVYMIVVFIYFSKKTITTNKQYRTVVPNHAHYIPITEKTYCILK